MRYNIRFKASNIPGNYNENADSISRKQWLRFRKIAPQANRTPAQVPKE